jgi:excisionase family DNA binding protein
MEVYMYFVYRLVDPRNNVTGYVGITGNPNQRYLKHIEGRGGKGEKYEWVRRLQEEGVQPKMKILEVVDDKVQAGIRERCWVQYYLRKGISLVNVRLNESAREIKKQMQPPDGYISITEACDRLNVSKAMVRHFVRKGQIEYLLPPGRQQGFYRESDVNELARMRGEF